MADARSVAQAGYEGMMAGKRLVVPGLFNRACVLGSKLSPRPVSTWTVRKLHEH
jgi:short-subunit dehydrogenase